MPESHYIRLRILWGAFRYPIIEDGIYVLIGSCLFVFLCDIIAQVTAFGLILQGFSCGYLAAYFCEIIRATAIGDERMPQWPSLTSWKESILEPLIMFYAALCISFSPSLAYGIIFSPKLTDPAFMICLFVSIYLLPSVLISIAFQDSFKGLLPWEFLKIMTLDGRLYLMIVLIFLVLIVAQYAVNALIPFRIFPVMSYAVNTIAGIYSMFVCSRSCGLFLRMTQDRLLECL